MWKPESASIVGLVWSALYYAALAVAVLTGIFNSAHPTHSFAMKVVLTAFLGSPFAAVPVFGSAVCMRELLSRIRSGCQRATVWPTLEEGLVFAVHLALASVVVLYFGPSRILGWAR